MRKDGVAWAEGTTGGERSPCLCSETEQGSGKSTGCACWGWCCEGNNWLSVHASTFLGGFATPPLYAECNIGPCVFCRSLLGKAGQRDSEVLKVCRGVERALHTLPCSWARVEPHAWSHAEELPKVVRGYIFQEQTRPLWIEEGND